MRESEEKVRKLRDALASLVGSSEEAELKEIKAVIRLTPAPDADKVSMINAIDILIETM